MHLIVCVEDRFGMSFCGRRLSKDAEVIGHILGLTKGCRLWTHPGSAELFPQGSVSCDDACFQKVGKDEFCFAEMEIPKWVLEQVEDVILYRWNRTYPSTVKFPRQLLDSRHMIASESFPGNSHEKITMERYVP